MREPDKPTETGVMDDLEWLQLAIQSYRPDRDGEDIIIHFRGRSAVIHPITAAEIMRSWADALAGGYVAAKDKKG